MRRFLFALLLLGLQSVSLPVWAAAPVKVVASFSVLADIAKQVGGDAVDVTSLVGVGGDTHVYQPTPTDAQAVAGADLIVTAGFGMEGWIDRLFEAAGYDGPILALSEAVDPIVRDAHDHDGHDEHAEEHDHHDHGDVHEHEAHDHDAHAHDAHDGHEEVHDHDTHDQDQGHVHAADDHHDHDGHDHGPVDPHTWHSVSAVIGFARIIEEALVTAAPAEAEGFHQRGEAFRSALHDLDQEIKAAWAQIPQDKRVVVVPHAAFHYYGRAYGVRFVSAGGLSTEAEPSARDLAELVHFLREEGAHAIFSETISDARLIETIAAEAGLAVGGHLYTGSLSAPEGEAGTYIEMLRFNTRQMVLALGGSL